MNRTREPAARRLLLRGAMSTAQRIVMMMVLGAATVAALPPRTAAAPAAPSEAAEQDDLELAGARVPVHGPSVGAVLTAAYAAAGLDRDPGKSWIRRARLAGLVPWVTVRTARDTSWQEPQSEVGHSTALEVRATWRLDRLLFDGRELQVAALEASRRRERRRLAVRVIRSYFTWRRAAGIADANDDRTSPRVAEAIAELDALTDGWFSVELARHRSSGATAPRTSR